MQSREATSSLTEVEFLDRRPPPWSRWERRVPIDPCLTSSLLSNVTSLFVDLRPLLMGTGSRRAYASKMSQNRSSLSDYSHHAIHWRIYQVPESAGVSSCICSASPSPLIHWHVSKVGLLRWMDFFSTLPYDIKQNTHKFNRTYKKCIHNFLCCTFTAKKMATFFILSVSNIIIALHPTWKVKVGYFL